MDGKVLTTVGGSLRHAHDVSPFLYNYNYAGSWGAFGPPLAYAYNGGSDTQENRLSRLYWQENLSLIDWATVALAASFENSDTGGQWPAYQGAVILKPFADHTFRVSAAKSPTTPSLANRNGKVWVPVGPFGIAALGDPAISTTQISDYEMSYTGNFFERHFSAEVTLYQMDANGLIYFNTEANFVPVVLPNTVGTAIQVVRYNNFSSAVLRRC